MNGAAQGSMARAAHQQGAAHPVARLSRWVPASNSVGSAERASAFSGLDAHLDELKTKGVEIMDTPGGTPWKVAPPPNESA